MPLLSQLRESEFVKINTSPDFDHFRSIDDLGAASSIPIDHKGFAASYATLRLGSCTIYLQRTFPRILQVQYRTTGAIVGFAMNEQAHLIFNGVASGPTSVLLVKGSASCEVTEQQANLVGFVHFDSIDIRGWPGAADTAQMIATDAVRLAVLKNLVRDVLMLASHSPDAYARPGVSEAIEESVLQAVDLVLAEASPGWEASRTGSSGYLALVGKFDDFLAANAGKTMRSADVARQLGVSVRTLHNAVLAIRGMSLQRYERLKRLWDARRQLLREPAPPSIRAVALANGFWQMGEFASQYRELFGETPQQTLVSDRRSPELP